MLKGKSDSAPKGPVTGQPSSQESIRNLVKKVIQKALQLLQIFRGCIYGQELLEHRSRHFKSA